MAKLPWMKFEPALWLRDTAKISLQAKGVWSDIICYAWNEPERGIYRRTISDMNHELRIPPEDSAQILKELEKVATVTISNDDVTIVSRKMLTDEKKREIDRNRQDRFRKNKAVTHVSRPRPNLVTGEKLEVRSKKEENVNDTVNPVPAAPVAPQPPKFGPENVMELWNEMAHRNLQRVMMLNKSREAHIKARLADFPDRQAWVSIIGKVNSSSFLTGLKKDVSWKASFDWILSPTNLTKIMEGNYDDQPPTR